MELLNKHIRKLKSDHKASPFFRSASPFFGLDCYEEPITICGEEQEEQEWAWDEAVTTPAVLLSKNNREVRFHPGYSSGTAAVRGNSPFIHGRIYYWEIKMLTALYGTDVMVGVGTKKVQLDKAAYQFCSLLGSDKESWGFSYTGKLVHDGKSHWYGPPFSKGNVIGIYLDMWKGTLEFFLNRRPLGVAFKCLQGYQLYPMVCSTAAQSAMRITVAVSHPVDLKLLSLRLLCTDREVMETLIHVPGIRRFLVSMWWILSAENRIAVEVGVSNISLDFENGLNRCNRKRPYEWQLFEFNDDAIFPDDGCIQSELPEISTCNIRRLRLACDGVL